MSCASNTSRGSGSSSVPSPRYPVNRLPEIGSSEELLQMRGVIAANNRRVSANQGHFFFQGRNGGISDSGGFAAARGWINKNKASLEKKDKLEEQLQIFTGMVKEYYTTEDENTKVSLVILDFEMN